MKALIAALFVLSLCPAIAAAAPKTVVLLKGAEPSASWSYGIVKDGTLYVSGMGGEDSKGAIAPTFEAELKQCLANIDAVLEEAGMAFAYVVSVQVDLADGALFERMNAVYKSYFNAPRPTRTTVIVAGLVGKGHVEITVTARK